MRGNGKRIQGTRWLPALGLMVLAQVPAHVFGSGKLPIRIGGDKQRAMRTYEWMRTQHQHSLTVTLVDSRNDKVRGRVVGVMPDFLTILEHGSGGLEQYFRWVEIDNIVVDAIMPRSPPHDPLRHRSD